MNLGNRQPSDTTPLSRLRRLTTSGYFTPFLVALFCAAVLFAAHERGHGNYHRLRSKVVPNAPESAQPTGPGGQDAIVLSRSPNAVGGEPEFLSATLLPGRGMNILQITASVPGRGEVPILFAPSLADADRILTGSGDDANGAVSATFGAAIFAPWAGRLTGSPTSSASTLESVWEGQRITFPPAHLGSTFSTPGALLDRPADNVTTETVPDGRSATAVYHVGSFSGDWPSMMNITVLVELSGHALDLTVTAQNTGQVPTPAGIGWHPVFNLQTNRDAVGITIPSITRVEVDRRTGLPTGKTVATASAGGDLVRARGTRLDDANFNETYTDLQSSILGDGPIAEIRQPSAGYGLRLTPLTANIKFMRVIAPSDQPWISIEPDTNVDDPFGQQWTSPDQTGIVTLQPGDSIQYRVRLEIFSLSAGGLTPPSSTNPQ
jgi:galactose mutarotase-like enzyme